MIKKHKNHIILLGFLMILIGIAYFFIYKREVNYPRRVDAFEIRFKPEFGEAEYKKIFGDNAPFIKSRNAIRVLGDWKEAIKDRLFTNIQEEKAGLLSYVQEVAPVLVYETRPKCYEAVDLFTVETDDQFTKEMVEAIANSIGGELIGFFNVNDVLGSATFWVPAVTLEERQVFIKRIEEQKNPHIDRVTKEVCDWTLGVQS